MTVPRLGAWREGSTVRWRVWAPDHSAVEVILFDDFGVETGHAVPLSPEAGGYFSGATNAAPARVLYKLRVDGAGPFPDPWSRAQPFGVHGVSEVLARDNFEWHDWNWQGRALEDLVIYEVHVGTATAAGTFQAFISKLDDLRTLGITAVELMPLASFPGRWNWGYDGVSLFAPFEGYGGPEGLKYLVDAAHQRGLAVLVDAVYNHLGPDGNYLGVYSSRYFTSRHKTPWGDAINYDGKDAGPVRELVCSNAEMWIREYHIDGLRLDATHAIFDDSPVHILQEIGERARAAAGGRSVLVIAEDERNDAKLISPVTRGGYGLDGVWADDFHHQLRRCFAGDSDGYFADFSGSLKDVAMTLNQGWFYTGQFAPHFGKERGTSPGQLALPSFVHCIQNHDQVGNRAMGDRLGQKVEPSTYKLMSAILLFSPGTPLIFMGQEWNASTPFVYFTDHNADLGRAVTEGRRKEFEKFAAFAGADVPDPQDQETFERSKLDWSERQCPGHLGILEWYRQLLRLRSTDASLRERSRSSFDAEAFGEDVLVLRRRHAGRTVTLHVVLRGPFDLQLPTGATLLFTSDDSPFEGSASVQRQPDGRITGSGPVALVFEN